MGFSTPTQEVSGFKVGNTHPLIGPASMKRALTAEVWDQLHIQGLVKEPRPRLFSQLERTEVGPPAECASHRLSEISILRPTRECQLSLNP